MAEDNELEKRAIEELLRETDRARLRAETMGPAGWLKCPLQSTNKRFLLNTLRSTDLQQRSLETESRRSATRGHLRSKTPDGHRDRSRTPPTRRHRHSEGRGDHKRPHRDHHSKGKDKDLDRDKDRERKWDKTDRKPDRHRLRD